MNWADLNAFYNASPVGLVLITVLLVDWLLPFPLHYQPSQFGQLLAHGISRKLAIKKRKTVPNGYGLYALVSYLLLLLIPLYSLIFVIEYDVWSQGLLLYLSLGYQPVVNLLKQAGTHVGEHNKSLYRTLLKPLTVNELSSMSAFGLNKLSCEILLVRFSQCYLLPIALFLLFDGAAALTGRLIVEAALVWSPSQKPFAVFGKAAFAIVNLLDNLVSWLLAPVFSVFHSSPGWLGLYRRVSPLWPFKQSYRSQLLWMSITAAGIKTEMAGPIMIGSEKLRRPRLNEGLQSADSLAELMAWQNRFRVAILVFTVIIAATLALANKV